MEIKSVRVDSRGIHGQVATTWIPHLKVNRVMVIDDKAIKDEIMKTALKLACPMGCKLSILSTDKAVERLSKDNYQGESILVLLLSVDTIYELYTKNKIFDEIILGNVSNKADTKQIAKTVFLNEDEINRLRHVEISGTNFIYQMVPGDSASKISFI